MISTKQKCISFAECCDSEYIQAIPFSGKINDGGGIGGIVYNIPHDIFYIWKGE